MERADWFWQARTDDAPFHIIRRCWCMLTGPRLRAGLCAKDKRKSYRGWSAIWDQWRPLPSHLAATAATRSHSQPVPNRVFSHPSLSQQHHAFRFPLAVDSFCDHTLPPAAPCRTHERQARPKRQRDKETAMWNGRHMVMGMMWRGSARDARVGDDVVSMSAQTGGVCC